MDTSESRRSSDPLLGCLLYLAARAGHPMTPAAVLAGLPLTEGRMSSRHLPEAAARAGLQAVLVSPARNALSRLALPAILFQTDNRARAVLSCDHKHGTARVYCPDTGRVETVPEADLARDYTGMAALVWRVEPFEARVTRWVAGSTRHWFWGTLWQFRGIYAQVLLAALLINLFSVAMPLFVMNVYDRVIPNAAVETLWVLTLGIVMILVFDFLIRSLRGYFVDLAGQRCDALLSSALMRQVLDIQMAARPRSAGGFSSQLMEFEQLRDFFTSSSILALVDLPFALIFIILLAVIGGSLALLPIFAIPLILIVAYLIERPLRRAVVKAQIGAAQKQALAVEAIGALEAIKSAGAQGTVLGRWERFVARTARAAVNVRTYSLLAVTITQLIQNLVYTAAILMGVYRVVAGDLSMGGLIACAIFATRSLAPMGGAAQLLTRLGRAQAALASLNGLMRQPVERPPGRRFLSRSSLQGAVQFERVSFQYPGETRQVLKGLNFRIQAGEHVGIIGRMGSGKSTVARLMLGLYAPGEGHITLDGVVLPQIDPAELRRNIAFVPQEPTLFYGSVRYNLSLGHPEATDAQILEAAQASGTDHFMRRYPNGYDLVLGEHGEGLSGGQRQSLMLGRALLAPAPLLLLDEPTTALDSSAERHVIESLRARAVGRTLMLITHKAPLLELVERLILLDDGRIIADGPKERVLAMMAGSDKTIP
ncbi:MAG: type I secretion system permease/ATPase [Nevskiales bacterium]|nr:type I secretion system permease/ATPase [Nevskiales bacterium]